MNLYLIDATYELFRSFYGYPKRLTEDGREVGAVRGLMEHIVRVKNNEENTYIAAAFDADVISFRNDLYSGYKTGEGMDPDILSQFELAQKSIELLGITLWKMYKYEADDAIATAVEKFKDQVEKIVIGSPDKDLAQCVEGDKVVMWSTRKKEYTNEKGVREKFGIQPKQIPDYLALAGDSSDGIPGIKGVGPKTASILVSKYGDIISIQKNSNEWVGEVRSGEKIRNALEEGMEEILLFKELATLRLDVPITSSINDLVPKEVNQIELNEFCSDLGFENFKY
tara:strand:+ start:1622 stop:2470 length:849 start_codon:yes stop_codon:yes gene_type:complete